MAVYVIDGGHPLRGEVRVQGSKNAAQKILPATVVFPGEYTIRNVPRIADSASLIEILRFLGATVDFLDEHTVRVDTQTVLMKEIPPEITAKSTGSFLFAGALLSRFGEVRIWHPGGDRIGKRPVTWHLDAFRQLGAHVVEEQEYYEVRSDSLIGCSFQFSHITVNGTVNAILASVRAEGTTVLNNVAMEPEIDNFIEFMKSSGAIVGRVEGKKIVVHGVSSGVGRGEIDIIPDRNDAATMLIAGVLGRGPVTLIGVDQDHLLPLIKTLYEAGTSVKEDNLGTQSIITVQCDRFRSLGWYVTSRPYPEFSTDWGPMTQVLMTQIPAESVFHETIFSQRFAHIPELIKMGARIEYFNPKIDENSYNFVRDPSSNLFHAVRIFGQTPLKGAAVSANDVRAGAALTLAGIIAIGETEISGVEQVNRGYEAFIERLTQLGASIRLNPSRSENTSSVLPKLLISK